MINKIPLGIRLNNPANIRYSPLNHWIGQIGQSKGFCKFQSVELGLRALVLTLRTYRFKYGLKTIRQIISRFAPPNENDTESYINFVVQFFNSRNHKVSADDELFLDFYIRFSQVEILASAICKQETGFELTSDEYLKVLLTLKYQ